MFAIIFILALFLPVAFLPLALDTFLSGTDLTEMGICLETSEISHPMQGCEFAGIFPTTHRQENISEYLWGVSEQLQACQ